MTWEEISKRIDREIKVGTEVPKTDGRTRAVTKIAGKRIYLRTGVKTNAQKYTTKEILQYAYNKIQSGERLASKDLKINFPKECSQGDCVFSMTGGILELMDEAKYTDGGYISK